MPNEMWKNYGRYWCINDNNEDNKGMDAMAKSVDIVQNFGNV